MSWIQNRLEEDRREGERKRALAAAVFQKARELQREWSPTVEGLLEDVAGQRWGKGWLRKRWKIDAHRPASAYPSWRLRKRNNREWYDLQLVCRKLPEQAWEGWREDQLTDAVTSITEEDFFFLMDWGRDRQIAALDAAELKELLWTAYHRGPTHARG